VDETIATEFSESVVGLAAVVQTLPFHRRMVPPSPTAQPSVDDTIARPLSQLVVGLVATVQELAALPVP
jgi:hypothetical protein